MPISAHSAAAIEIAAALNNLDVGLMPADGTPLASLVMETDISCFSTEPQNFDDLFKAIEEATLLKNIDGGEQTGTSYQLQIERVSDIVVEATRKIDAYVRGTVTPIFRNLTGQLEASFSGASASVQPFTIEMVADPEIIGDTVVAALFSDAAVLTDGTPLKFPNLAVSDKTDEQLAEMFVSGVEKVDKYFALTSTKDTHDFGAAVDAIRGKRAITPFIGMPDTVSFRTIGALLIFVENIASKVEYAPIGVTATMHAEIMKQMASALRSMLKRSVEILTYEVNRSEIFASHSDRSDYRASGSRVIYVRREKYLEMVKAGTVSPELISGAVLANVKVQRYADLIPQRERLIAYYDQYLKTAALQLAAERQGRFKFTAHNVFVGWINENIDVHDRQTYLDRFVHEFNEHYDPSTVDRPADLVKEFVLRTFYSRSPVRMYIEAIDSVPESVAPDERLMYARIAYISSYLAGSCVYVQR